MSARVGFSLTAGERVLAVETAVLRYVTGCSDGVRATPAAIARELGADLAASDAEVETALQRLVVEGAIVCQARPEKSWRRPGVWSAPVVPAAAPTWVWLYEGGS